MIISNPSPRRKTRRSPLHEKASFPRSNLLRGSGICISFDTGPEMTCFPETRFGVMEFIEEPTGWIVVVTNDGISGSQ